MEHIRPYQPTKHESFFFIIYQRAQHLPEKEVLGHLAWGYDNDLS
jgi:hypothetical protein